MKFKSFLLIVGLCCFTKVQYSSAWGSLFGSVGKEEVIIGSAVDTAESTSTLALKQKQTIELIETRHVDESEKPGDCEIENDNEGSQIQTLKAEVDPNGRTDLLIDKKKKKTEETNHATASIEKEPKSENLNAHRVARGKCKLEDIGLMLGATWEPPQKFYDCHSIDISWTELSDTSLAHLAVKIKHHAYLNKVGFADAKHVTVAGCKDIASSVAYNDNIQSFSFTNSDLNDDCIEIFGKVLIAGGSNRISSLDLSENSITSSGAIILARYISKKVPGLKSIKLSYNRINQQGGAALGESIEGHPTLSIVKFDNNMLGNGVLKHMQLSMQTESKIYYIDVAETNLHSESGLHLSSILKRNTNIEILDLSGNLRFSPTGAKYLAEGLTKALSLRELKMRYCDVSDDGTIAIANALMGLNNLEVLDLTWNNIGDKGAKKIADLLRVNRSIKRVVLTRNGIGAVGFQALGNALKSNFVLQSLDLEYNQAHQDDRIQTYLARNLLNG